MGVAGDKVLRLSVFELNGVRAFLRTAGWQYDWGVQTETNLCSHFSPIIPASAPRRSQLLVI
jgi:hypothetical protein